MKICVSHFIIRPGDRNCKECNAPVDSVAYVVATSLSGSIAGKYFRMRIFRLFPLHVLGPRLILIKQVT